METRYTVLNYRIDLYFHDYKLAVEINEGGHRDRNENYEKQREELIKKELDCVFIRVNPDEENFKMSKVNNKIFRHVKKSITTLMVKDLERSVKIIKMSG